MIGGEDLFPGDLFWVFGVTGLLFRGYYWARRERGRSDCLLRGNFFFIDALGDPIEADSGAKFFSRCRVQG